jgi:hypothetical protein
MGDQFRGLKRLVDLRWEFDWGRGRRKNGFSWGENDDIFSYLFIYLF